MRPTSSTCVEPAPSSLSPSLTNWAVSTELTPAPLTPNVYDRLRAISPSSSPLTKRTKLHREKTPRKLSACLSCNKSAIPNNTENATGEHTNPSRGSQELKSGNLVLVSWPRGALERSRSRSYPSEYQAPPRCPCIVQVCRRYHEHWAVVRKTRQRLSEKPHFLNLRSCRLTRYSALQFTVHLDGAEGRAFTFEASSSEIADEWVRTFTPIFSQSEASLRKLSDNVTNHSLDIPEEIEEENDDSNDVLPACHAGFKLEKRLSGEDVILEEEEENSSEEDVQEMSTLSDITNKMDEYFGAPKTVNNTCVTSAATWRDILLKDGGPSRTRTTSLPVLYEEE